MTPPLVVSFHTPDRFFTEGAARLRDSCSRFGLEHDIVRRDDLADWHRMDIIRRKPKFIAEKLREHDQPLLWTDCDSEFVHDPREFWLLIGDADFGYRPRWHYKRQTRQVFAGTIYATPAALPLVHAWALCSATTEPDGDDQYYLAHLLKRGAGELLTMAEWGPELVRKDDEHGIEPVIMHYMAKHHD